MFSSIENPKFQRTKNNDFAKTLRSRVNLHFKISNTTRNADSTMVVKTIIMLTLFFAPLILLATGLVASVWLLFLLYIISGLGMAGIGMGVMHDAIHGSYSKHRKINTLLSYTFNLIGANATVWKIQHNILHHTYTNIDHADDDLNAPFFLRFSPNAKHYWVHQFQHIYIWFFYAISTLSWITTKDFVRLNRYRNMGFLDKKNEYKKELASMVVWKALYYGYALLLPMIMVPQSWAIILLAFLCMHFVTGFLVSIVFQIAHIMPMNEFPLPNEKGMMKDDWYGHQFATTTNFSPNSKLIFWLVGGLNYQVEHHVLPDVCHVHYKKITKIVADTAREFGLPYHVKKTLLHAVKDHIKMLRWLGKKQTGANINTMVT
ncbi:acyl-CoA desaturase [Hyunsoonleella sp. SJ7]|uniref:Acyl-CoA desaturase n=1 Tax=Hyunsoonleella aquatilis TaxID=2762758 RepID=A0A923KIM7_9FLAO|nr:acyl-CoA desaturase [Hyunsoonleella aquatilis]MBC3758844.1 acyl-CoA desaturase [Hyunsoonleella aquatilis]